MPRFQLDVTFAHGHSGTFFCEGPTWRSVIDRITNGHWIFAEDGRAINPQQLCTFKLYPEPPK